MDALVFNCPGCGQPVDIDFKTRKGHCEWCGNIVTYPRKAFNGDEKVQNEVKLCVRCFTEKRFSEAKSHAENILAVAIDNAPALFARAYFEAFFAVNKNSARVREFFEQLRGIEMDAEEIEPLRQLFLASIFKLEDYESEVLYWATQNLRGAELCKFTEEFSPALIVKRTSIDFFTLNLAELYKKISGECSIPKTCYALLQAITTNPDSPYPKNRFFLETKTQRFYNDFVLPVGEIIRNMKSEELKAKFYQVFKTKLKDYENKMNGGNN